MDKETYDVVFTKYKSAESDSPEQKEALKELIEVLQIQKAYNEVYPLELTGMKALLNNSALVNFGRDVLITTLILKYEQVNILTTRVGSFVRTSRK